MTAALGEYPAAFAMAVSGPAAASALGEYPAALALAVSYVLRLGASGRSCCYFALVLLLRYPGGWLEGVESYSGTCC